MIGFVLHVIALYSYSTSASKTIYSKVVENLLATPLRFFDTTP